MENITTIRLTKATRDRLKMCGFKADTYSEIVDKLIDKYEME